MTTTYTYSKSINFPNGIDVGKLYIEITSNVSIITANLININTMNNEVNITFNNSLTIDEKNILDTLISNHLPTQVMKYSYSKIIFSGLVTTNSSNYKSMITFIYNGSDPEMSNINNMLIISYMDSDITNYNIQCIDITNNKIIFTGTEKNNTSEEILIFNNLNNIPNNSAIFEVSVLKNGGAKTSKIYLKNVSLCKL